MAKRFKRRDRPNFLQGGFNLPELEEKILAFWNERDIFRKSVEQRRARGKSGKSASFVFYEGPPTANGRPGVHHVLSRAFKDLVPRYKAMRGYYAPRRAGWDTHGLPVELQVEKQLGLKSKKEIEQYGIAAFNEKCRESVWEFKEAWESMTRRMGYWVDLDNPYITYQAEYMESLWWIIAQFFKKDMLYKGHRVVPWCTRCGTALSSHELAQGYQETTDQSVYIKFKLKSGQAIGDFVTNDQTYILSWTTTPWTLPGNVALAVGADVPYAAVRFHVAGAGAPELYIVAKDLVKSVFGDQSVEIVRDDINGADLVGLVYKPLFEVEPLKSPESYKVYAADFVTTTDGTGVVHTAVMYGEDDYALGKKIGLPQKHTVDEEGEFTNDVPGLAGHYVKSKTTEEHIFEYLRRHNNFLRAQAHTHEYPHCWRCGTAILYYARTSWFVAMSKLRGELLKNNETIHWVPEHIKEGRFGEWLKEVKDWNFSRERYWGTPLPIWECAHCGRTEVVESMEALSKLAGGSRNDYWVMRHGEAESNALKIIDGGSGNFHLTEKGRTEVHEAARELKKKNEKHPIDFIIASPIVRAQETAKIAAEALEVEVLSDPRLRELQTGPQFDGRPVEKYWNAYPHYEDRFEKRPGGGESRRDVRTRMAEFIKDCERRYDGKNILIITHGDPALMLTQTARGLSEKTVIDDFRSLYLDPAEYMPLGMLVIPRDATGLADLHRPFIDEITLPCKKCRKEMKRVREVVDAWYDSGAMPFANKHFPFEVSPSKRKKAIEDPTSAIPFPADYISEAVDQTRGWFYTLLAVATALGQGAPYKNVICLGHINDKNGQKMSKSKGNIVDPWAMMSTYGVDAVRWYFYTATPPGDPKNFDEAEIAKKLRQVHLIVYNSFVFWKTYAEQDAMQGLAAETISQILKNPKNILDEWIVGQLNELQLAVTQYLDAYHIREAALAIEGFVDDLSRWYIRRSRRRLQRPDDAPDYRAASVTLGFVLLELAKLFAPFTPFFAEALYSGMDGNEESVHLDVWNAGSATENGTFGALKKNMTTVRELAALGLAKRSEVKIKVRQPLATMTIKNDTLKNHDALLAILAEEVNVKKVVCDPRLTEEVALDTAITPELREEGLVREIARMVQELRQSAGLATKDKITLMISGPEALTAAIGKNEASFKDDIGAKLIEYKRSEKFDAESATKLDGEDLWIALREV